MSLDIKQIEHISHLARLELNQQEKEKFAQQLSSILEYFEKLKEVDTSNVEPTSQSIPLINVDRPDEVKDCPEDIRKNILNNAPEKNGKYFKANKIL